MSLIRRSVLAALGCAAVIAFAPGQAAAAGLASPFASISVSCPANGSGSTTSGTPVSVAHPRVLAKMRNANGSGYLSVGRGGFGTDETTFVAGDARWLDLGSLSVNDTPNAQLSSCGPGGASAVVDLYDMPDAPVSFDDQQLAPASWSDTLVFRAPTTARFVADVNLTQGAISVCMLGDCFNTSRTLASSGTVPLGQLQGAEAVSIDALDGPSARYSVTIRPLPVAVNEAKFDRAFIAPGSPATATYSLDGETNVTATVLNAAGQPVRQLAANQPFQPGQRSLTWDGKDSAGNLLPDGGYTLRIDSRDPYGGAHSGSAQITLDGSGPAVALSAPTTTNGAVTVTLTDPGAGVDTVGSTVRVDEPPSSSDAFMSSDVSSSSSFSGSGAQATAVIRPPSGGWKIGTVYTVRVQATDRLENASSLVQAFTIAAPGNAAGGSAVAATLSKARAAAAVRSAIRKRLRGARIARVTCRRASTLRLSCTFRARKGRRTATGSGTVFRTSASSTRVRYSFRVRYRGTTRRWRG